MASIDTLAALETHGYALWASCSLDAACTHFAALGTGQLIARFGPDFDFVDNRRRLTKALRCRRCGRKGAEVRLSALNTASAGQGHSVSGKGR